LWSVSFANPQSSTINAGLEAITGRKWIAHQISKPLLANDPILATAYPASVHGPLKAPGLNVSGVSLPGLPLVIIGHNEHIAWGLTNTAPDVQDLFVESINPHDPGKYQHNGQW